jgi:DNA-binding PadR family transcriptional regulator
MRKSFDMPRGRKFSAEDLQLLLLSLLQEAPRHGYELIKALEVRSNGFYTPSPGMVYPALTYLEELGYATVEMEGSRKRYALSDAGLQYLDANREHIDLMLAKLKHFALKMDSVRRAFSGEEPDDSGEGGHWIAELREARHAIKRVLYSRSHIGREEQLRIANILVKAAADIDNGSTPQQG